MKRILGIIIILLPLVVFAQVDSLWSKIYGVEYYVDECYAVQQTADCGYILAGSSQTFWEWGSSFWLIKTDRNGDSLWSRRFGASENDVCNSVQLTDDGGYILAGYTISYGEGGQDFWMVKTNANGDSLWRRSFGGVEDDICKSVVQTTDGGYALAGYATSLGAGQRDFWLIKTDANGDSVWSRTYGGSGQDHCMAMQQTAGRRIHSGRFY